MSFSAKWTRAVARAPFLVVAFGAVQAIPAAAQTPPAWDPPPTLPGTAVVTQGPLDVDTIPILCHHTEQADHGFITESGNAEWAPEIDLSLWPTPDAADSLSLRFDNGTTYDATFTRGTYETGSFMAGVNLVPWDTGRGFDLYFVANCSERLVRGG